MSMGRINRKAGMLVTALMVALSLALPLEVHAAPQIGTEQASAQAEQRMPVTVVRVQRRTIEDWRESVGQLEPFEAPVLSAEVSGRIVQVRVKEGDAVKAGEVLAKVDDADYLLQRDLARADIARVQALLKAAQLRVWRISTLVRKGNAPQSTLDDATAQLDSLRAQLAAARVRLKQAERNLAKTRIISPVSGRVSRRMISVGDLVAPGKPLFRVVATGRMKVRLPYPERDLALIRPGQPMQLTTPAAPGEVVKTTVTGVSPEIDAASRSAHVLVVMQNVHGWRSGASVDGRILVRRRENVPVVPEKAVVLRPAGHVVYVAGEDGRAYARKVRPGLRLDGLVEIIDGFTGGERVVADGAGFVIDGVMLEIKE